MCLRGLKFNHIHTFSSFPIPTLLLTVSIQIRKKELEKKARVEQTPMDLFFLLDYIILYLFRVDVIKAPDWGGV